MAGFDFDLFVIGGGSGGVRAARKAAGTGARVAIAEDDRFGGTCVIRGCVPKKLFVYAAQFAEAFQDCAGYGWSVDGVSFDWPTLVANKDVEIARLEAAYRAGLAEASVELFEVWAALDGAHTIALPGLDRKMTAERILIATGGRANPHRALNGHELCITSKEAFDLERLPQSIAIVGGGYIAVEFAGIFNGLGVDTTIVYRGKEILQRFDMDLRTLLHAEYENKGIKIRCHEIFTNIEKQADGRLKGTLSSGDTIETDAVMLAVGRLPNTDNLGLETVAVKTGPNGAIVVDEYSQTNIDHIWAIGDVTDRMQLTPVAIHEAMCFVDTLYRGRPTRPDYDSVATVVFSQPEIGTVGLSEDEAISRFGNLDIFSSTFRPMKNTLAQRSGRMLVKLVVDADTDRVLGAHVLGPGAGEMTQLLGIALKMGATRTDFDATMAVHPTSAEEFVTFAEPLRRIRGGKTL